ncbi:cell surface glycoprotein MUC18 [Rhinophrynus dorsalis]
MDFLLVFSLCLLSWKGVWGLEDGESQMEATEGKTTKIPCTAYSSSLSDITSVEWLYEKNGLHLIYKSGPEEKSIENTELKTRVQVAEDYTLIINPTRIQDERMYVCRLLDQIDITLESRTQLHVYKAPETPEITVNDEFIKETNDSEEIMSCHSKNGFPAPNITWYKNDVPLQHEKEKVQITSLLTQESSGLYTVTSTLSMPVQRSDNGAVFYCDVSYHLPEGDHMMESERKNITFSYTNKKLTLFKKSPVGLVVEGDTVELKCLGDGNPQPEVTYRKKDMDDDLGDGPSLILENVQRKDSGGYICQGFDFNDFDTTLIAETEIHVHFLDQPEFSQKSPIIVPVGGNLSVSCQANASVDTETQWKHKGKVIAQDSSLTLSQVNYGDSGKYMCFVELHGVPRLNVNKELEIIVRGKPEVSVITQPIYAQENDVVNVTCKALSHPKATITWSVNGTVTERKEGHEVISELSFIVTPELFMSGVTCTASNKLGSSEEEIQLEKKLVTTAPPVPETEENIIKEPTRGGSHGVAIVAVIVCILLLAILGAVLYFLYKKGRIPCGHSGKKDITKPGEKDQIVVEMKTDSPVEDSVLLPGPQDKKPPGDQGEKYNDLRN